jgi:hypothetical protein
MVYLLTLRHLRLSFQIVILQSNIKFPEGVQLETCFFFSMGGAQVLAVAMFACGQHHSRMLFALNVGWGFFWST